MKTKTQKELSFWNSIKVATAFLFLKTAWDKSIEIYRTVTPQKDMYFIGIGCLFLGFILILWAWKSTHSQSLSWPIPKAQKINTRRRNSANE